MKVRLCYRETPIKMELVRNSRDAYLILIADIPKDAGGECQRISCFLDLQPRLFTYTPTTAENENLLDHRRCLFTFIMHPIIMHTASFRLVEKSQNETSLNMGLLHTLIMHSHPHETAQ